MFILTYEYKNIRDLTFLFEIWGFVQSRASSGESSTDVDYHQNS